MYRTVDGFADDEVVAIDALRHRRPMRRLSSVEEDALALNGLGAHRRRVARTGYDDELSNITSPNDDGMALNDFITLDGVGEMGKGFFKKWKKKHMKVASFVNPVFIHKRHIEMLKKLAKKHKGKKKKKGGGGGGGGGGDEAEAIVEGAEESPGTVTVPAGVGPAAIVTSPAYGLPATDYAMPPTYGAPSVQAGTTAPAQMPYGNAAMEAYSENAYGSGQQNFGYTGSAPPDEEEFSGADADEGASMALRPEQEGGGEDGELEGLGFHRFARYNRFQHNRRSPMLQGLGFDFGWGAATSAGTSAAAAASKYAASQPSSGGLPPEFGTALTSIVTAAGGIAAQVMKAKADAAAAKAQAKADRASIIAQAAPMPGYYPAPAPPSQVPTWVWVAGAAAAAFAFFSMSGGRR